MATMAKVEERYTLTAVNRRKYFRERLLERIRAQIGTDNADQEIKEQVLLDVCAKVTAVYVGCLNAVENDLGNDGWALDMEFEQFQKMSKEQQEKCKVLSMVWYECKSSIKKLGNDIISDVIYILSQVEITPKNGVDILGQAALKEKKWITLKEKENENERE